MDLSDDNLIYRYWGKAEKASEQGIPPYHLLAYHCLDVAAVGNVLLDRQPDLLQYFSNLSGMNSKLFLNWITFLLAIHDVGKFADVFQNLRPDLSQQLQNRSTQALYNERHDTLGYRFFLDCVIPAFVKTVNPAHGRDISEDDLGDLLKPWLGAVTGHHGRPPKPDVLPQAIHAVFLYLVVSGSILTFKVSCHSLQSQSARFYYTINTVIITIANLGNSFTWKMSS